MAEKEKLREENEKLRAQVADQKALIADQKARLEANEATESSAAKIMRILNAILEKMQGWAIADIVFGVLFGIDFAMFFVAAALHVKSTDCCDRWFNRKDRKEAGELGEYVCQKGGVMGFILLIAAVLWYFGNPGEL